MKLLSLEVCYIPYKKSDYQMAKEEMANLTVKEINGIIICATLIVLGRINTVKAGIDIFGFANKIDTKGGQILTLIQSVGYWVAIVYAGIDIIKSFKKQDIAGIIGIASKYSLAVGLLYGLPDIFDMVKDLFKQ